MGVIRFLAPRPERMGREAIARAYFAGLDGIPWMSRNRATETGFQLERAVADSGCLYISWNRGTGQELTLSTGSLMERERPYLLPLELARGTLNRLRNNQATWLASGLTIPAKLATLSAHANELFTQALVHQSDEMKAADLANESLVMGVDAIELLAEEFTTQALEFRHRSSQRLATLFAPTLGLAPFSEKEGDWIRSTFNTVALAPRWKETEVNPGEYDWTAWDRQLQWCRTQNMKVCLGPLIALDNRNLPDWLYLWEDEFDHLVNYARTFVEQAVQRYRGRVHLWHVAARLNQPSSLPMSEEKKLRLAVEGIDAVRKHDPRTPVIVSFSQPWGESLAQDPIDMSPLHFADAVVRADLGLTGLGMEVNYDYWPQGTLPRDNLEVNLQIDRWSMLGLPLVVIFSAPSAAAEGSANKPIPITSGTGHPSPESQRKTAAQVAKLILAKPAVQGFIWGEWSDALAPEYPFGGLLDERGRPKPALEALAKIRRDHLL